MTESPKKSKDLYVAAYPFADDVLALPVKDIEQAVKWYGRRIWPSGY